MFICSFMFLHIDSFIVGKAFVFMFICSYVLIHSLQVKLLSYDYLFLCIDSFIDSFIAGKTMENLRNRRMVDLVTSEEKLKKPAAQPSFKQFKMFHENLVAVEQAKV